MSKSKRDLGSVSIKTIKVDDCPGYVMQLAPYTVAVVNAGPVPFSSSYERIAVGLAKCHSNKEEWDPARGELIAVGRVAKKLRKFQYEEVEVGSDPLKLFFKDTKDK